MLILYIVRFFSALALFAILPFFSVWLTRTHLFTAAMVALLVGILILSNRLTSFFIAPLVTHKHKKHVTIFSLSGGIICSIGMYFAVHANVDFIYFWIVIVIIFGMLFSATSLCLNTLIADLAKSHLTGFSYFNAVVNLGSGLGPFIGGLVMHYHPTLTALLPAFFLVIALVFCLLLPLDKDLPVKSVPFKQIFQFIDYRTNLLLLSNFLLLIAYAQFYETFPLLAKHFITPRSIGILFLISGITIALLQIPISRLSKRNHFISLVFSHLFFFIGLVLLTFVSTNIYSALVVGVILISMAEIIYGPIYQTLCVAWHTKVSPEVAIGRLNLMWGGGNSLAAFIGLYWVGHQHFFYPYILGGGALILATILLFLNKHAFISGN